MTRPRDRLGRPLRPGSEDAEPAVPADVAVSDEAAWAAATTYLARGLPFHAHEACELRWRAAPANSRAVWRALAQWGAALTHEARGNRVGARRVAERALASLAEGGDVPPIVDLDLVRSSCASLVADPEVAAEPDDRAQ